MNKPLRITIFLISLFVFIIFSNLIHELSHKHDYRKIAFNDKITILMFEDDNNKIKVAEYKFDYYLKDIKEKERIDKFTEVKADTLDYGMLLIYILIIILGVRGEGKDERKKEMY